MISTSYAPICLFVYKRPIAVTKTIDSLLTNSLAKYSNLHIFSDGAINDTDAERVEAVRKYVRSITGFKSVSIYYANSNKGLANSIIDGVSQIISKAGRVIVLEDDLIVSNNFLDFMNEALTSYNDNAKLFSVAGYSSPMTTAGNADVYFTRRGSSWGWATWKDRWQKIDWQVRDYDAFAADKHAGRRFNNMGSDLSGMLRRQMEGRINSWAIRWVYHQFKHNLFSVFPAVSKVINEGFNVNATNTSSNNYTRFTTPLDESGKTGFSFPEHPVLKSSIIKQFVAPYSIRTRAYYKIKELLHL